MKCKIDKFQYGRTISGNVVNAFNIRSKNLQILVSEYGATIISIILKDGNGIYRDVVLGYDSLNQYEEDQHFFGATIGRIAGVVSNSQFEVNGTSYKLTSQGKHHYHGGPNGLNKQVWRGGETECGVQMDIISPDKSSGYPGEVHISILFQLIADSCFVLRYNATSDADTYLNLTNHTYFNLNGHSNGSCLNHNIRINSTKFIPVDHDEIPLGIFNSVKNSSFDFRQICNLGERIHSDDQRIIEMKGIDHYFILSRDKFKYYPDVFLSSPDTKIKLKLFTTYPGIYFYTGNGIRDGLIGKNDCRYRPYSGVAIESQYFPDGPNRPNFICPKLLSNELYSHNTYYLFESK